jgi:nicotinamide mononucleotide adenylyltransferase
MWEKKYHAKSSMQEKEGQFAMFVGRWQILHDGHKQLFQQALDEGKNVLICVRDCQPDERNPKSSQEVWQEIAVFYKDLIMQKRLVVMIIPDICSVNFGRGVGYDIIEYVPPTEIAEISASKIRANAAQ